MFEDDAKLKKCRNWNPDSGIFFQVLFKINNLRSDLIVYFIGKKSDTSCVGRIIFPFEKGNEMKKFDRDAPLTKEQKLFDLYNMHAQVVNSINLFCNPLSFEAFSRVVGDSLGTDSLGVALEKADRFATENFKYEDLSCVIDFWEGKTKEGNESVVFHPEAKCWVHTEALPTYY
jgi:hypothetical protein